jgi:nitrate reductase alpha subunit
VLPAATWYEKHDLSSTDMHPFVHSFNPAISPPWETRTDFDAFQGIAKAFSDLAAEHLGTRRTWWRCRWRTTPPTSCRTPVGR